MKLKFNWIILSLFCLLEIQVARAQEDKHATPATPQALDSSNNPPSDLAAAPSASGRSIPFGMVDLESLLNVVVQTASKEEEPLQEAPVPVTVITSQMIRASGARNLQDVLATFVPGMSIVMDHNELNVAMHGVYGSSQQKILFLLDGHRLNSRAYSCANPDFGFSIPFDKIKQIEVLRGPGSSLYGNVALTGVVNIVTKRGGELNGTSVRIGGGEFISGYPDEISGDGILKAGKSLDIVYGKEFKPDNDLLLWGSLFQAEGQRIAISKENDYSPKPQDGYAILGGFSDPLSYDLGLKYRIKGFTVLGSLNQGKWTEPFSGGGTTGMTYEYDYYRKLMNLGPGLSSQSMHFDLKYARSLGRSTDLEIDAYYGRNALKAYIISDPSTGSANYLSWDDDVIGGTAQARYHYNFGDIGTGDILLGTQVDGMRLNDSFLILASNYEFSKFFDTKEDRILKKGSEIIYTGFTQIKHRIDQFIFNVGARFDIKDRFKGDNVWDLSPRAAVVWSPNRMFDIKASFAQSFVDAPYWYRYNTLPSYKGSENLMPEHLRAVQLTPTINLLDGKLSNTFNVYYNQVYEVIVRDVDPNSTIKYKNSGSLETIGVEDEIAFIQNFYRARANFTFQYVIDSENVDAADWRIYNIPPFIANVILDVNPFGRYYRYAWVNLTGRFLSEQLAPIRTKMPPEAGSTTPTDLVDLNHTTGPYFLLNIGVHLSKVFIDELFLDATVYNLLDTKVYQGGSTAHPYPMAGRFFMTYLRYLF